MQPIKRITTPVLSAWYSEADKTDQDLLPPRRGEPFRGSEDHPVRARKDVLADIADDPGLQAFYDRVIPADITPAAWMPFWPSAWRGGALVDAGTDSLTDGRPEPYPARSRRRGLSKLWHAFSEPLPGGRRFETRSSRRTPHGPDETPDGKAVEKEV